MACILIVDDHPFVVRTIRIILEQAGHTVFLAADGQECEEVMAFARPDVVVMDIFMPRRDGLEAIRILRQSGVSARVLAVSGGSREGNEDPLALARSLGADATLQKPFDATELLHAVEQLLPEALRPRRGD
jgi:two-component system, OmpR family, response regulator CpxR